MSLDDWRTCAAGRNMPENRPTCNFRRRECASGRTLEKDRGRGLPDLRVASAHARWRHQRELVLVPAFIHFPAPLAQHGDRRVLPQRQVGAAESYQPPNARILLDQLSLCLALGTATEGYLTAN
jgi:hypothetical protein